MNSEFFQKLFGFPNPPADKASDTHSRCLTIYRPSKQNREADEIALFENQLMRNIHNFWQGILGQRSIYNRFEDLFNELIPQRVDIENEHGEDGEIEEPQFHYRTSFQQFSRLADGMEEELTIQADSDGNRKEVRRQRFPDGHEIVTTTEPSTTSYNNNNRTIGDITEDASNNSFRESQRFGQHKLEDLRPSERRSIPIRFERDQELDQRQQRVQQQQQRSQVEANEYNNSERPRQIPIRFVSHDEYNEPAKRIVEAPQKQQQHYGSRDDWFEYWMRQQADAQKEFECWEREFFGFGNNHQRDEPTFFPGFWRREEPPRWSFDSRERDQSSCDKCTQVNSHGSSEKRYGVSELPLPPRSTSKLKDDSFTTKHDSSSSTLESLKNWFRII